jgi:hypothetical protein
LDARGHLRLTDLGLCKKVGEVSPSDEPEVILEMLRNNTIADDVSTSAAPMATGISGSAAHRGSDDGMAMSIEDMPKELRDAKSRREVSKSRLMITNALIVSLGFETSLTCLSIYVFVSH